MNLFQSKRIAVSTCEREEGGRCGREALLRCRFLWQTRQCITTQTTLWKRRKYIRLSFTINYKLVQEPRNNSLCGWAKILAVSKDLGRSTTWILNCKFYLNLPSPNFPNSSQDIPPHSPTISQWHYRQLDEHTAYTKGLEVLVLLYFSQSLSPGTLIVISSLNILHSKPPNDVLGQRLSQENEDKIPLNSKTNSYCSCK